jgi:hypothetical protein
MPATPSFNILVIQKASRSAFVHRAARSNTEGNHTFINSRLLNGNPRASIQITQLYNPGGTLAGTFNPHPVGVRYYPSAKKWAIFNEDNKNIPLGTAFEVLAGAAPSNGGKTAVVTVTKFDHKIGTILVNDALSNNNPNNVTFVTQVFNPGGKGAIGDAHPLEVGYPNPGSKIFKETINNADFSTAPQRAAFNVLIFSS